MVQAIARSKARLTERQQFWLDHLPLPVGGSLGRWSAWMGVPSADGRGTSSPKDQAVPFTVRKSQGRIGALLEDTGLAVRIQHPDSVGEGRFQACQTTNRTTAQPGRCLAGQ